jgi:hypothetical protein
MLTLLAVMAFTNAFATSTYDDTDLKKDLLQAKSSQQTVIFYSWSPHMVLSQKGLKELLQRPASKKLRIVPVMDGNSNRDLAQKIVSRNRWPASVMRELEAPELIRRGLRTHYPSYFVSSKGDAKGKLIPGYKSPQYLNRILAKAGK